MKFEKANINGEVGKIELYTKAHRFGLIASTTSTTYGQPLYLKAVSDAAMQKTEPVTFYGRLGSASTTTLATATFVNTVECFAVVDNLSTGTWTIWATWPGEGIYSSATTARSLITHRVQAGANIGGQTNLTFTPSSGALVVGEGTATFTATMTTSTVIPGSHFWFVNGQQVATRAIEDNKSTLQLSNLGTGTNTIRVTWPGGEIGGTQYSGQTTSTTYVIRRGTTATATLNLAITPVNYGIFQEGTVRLTATLSTATTYPGNIQFYKNNQLLYTGPMTNNSATYTFNNIDAVGTYTFHAIWDGNQSSHPRYIEIQSSTSTWNVLARETVPSMTLDIDPLLSDFSLPVDFTATLNTSTTINTGTISFVLGTDVIAVVPIVNNVAEFTTYSLSTGTFQAYAYYAGSLVEPKYFPVTSNTLTMTVTSGVSIGANLNIAVESDSYVGTGQPYVKNETLTLKATLPTNKNVQDYVRFRNLTNFSTIGFADFVFTGTNNTATTTTVFTSSGTYQLQAIWDGALIDGIFYAGQTTSTTITVVDGYTMPSELVLTASQPRVIDENIVFTATITTSSVMANTVTFYANTLTLGTAQFNTLTNRATFTTTIANSGTYTIQAIWSGGLIDGGRPYLPKASSTSSMFVDFAADFLYPLTLTANSATNSVGSSTVLTAVINTTTNLSGAGAGTVTFKETTYNRTLGTGTISTNVAQITVPGDTFVTATNYTWQALWSGSTSAPKFKAKSTTTAQTYVARGTAYPVLDIKNFYRNELDGFTTKLIATATVFVTGTYATHQPGGSVELYDGATLINTATIVNGVAEFSWLPTAFNQLDSGTRSISAVYLRDSWNNSATSAVSSWYADTRRTTEMTMSMGNTATFRPSNVPITILATSTYFSGKVLDIYEGASVIGQATFVGSTATYNLPTQSVSLGQHSYYAVFQEDWAYKTTATNTVTFTVSKGTVPLTLDINTAGFIYSEFVAGQYQIRRPETVNFRVTSTTTYNLPKVIELRKNGNLWTTATYTGTTLTISTSSSAMLVDSASYTVNFAGDDNYNATTSTGISVVVDKFRLPRPTIALSASSVLRPNTYQVSLSTTDTRWIGRSMTVYSSSTALGTMTFNALSTQTTFSSSVTPVGTTQVYGTWTETTDFYATNTNFESLTVGKTSGLMFLDGPRAPSFSLNTDPQGNFVIDTLDNNFDRQFMSGQTLLFTATTTATHLEGATVYLRKDSLPSWPVLDPDYVATGTILTSGTIVGGTVTLPVQTTNTNLNVWINTIHVTYTANNDYAFVGAINTWTYTNPTIKPYGWPIYLNDYSNYYTGFQLQANTTTVYNTTTVVVTATVADSNVSAYLEGKTISWTTSTAFNNDGVPIAFSQFSGGKATFIATGTNVPSLIRPWYYDDIWTRPWATFPGISFTKIP